MVLDVRVIAKDDRVGLVDVLLACDHAEQRGTAGGHLEIVGLEDGAARRQRGEHRLKYPATKADDPLRARVYVARADTSAPVADAQVRLELKGGTTFAGDAKTTDVAGVYEITLPPPPEGAQANGVVSVQTKDDFDLVLVGDLRFGPFETTATPTASPRRGLPLWALISAAGALSGLTGALGFTLGRHSTRKAPPPAPEEAERHALSEVTS